MRSMLWVLAVLAVGAHAADDEERTPCDKVDTSAQSLACSAYNKDTAQSGLDEAYNQLMARISAQFSDQKDVLKSYQDKVKAANDLWLKLRDADCAVETLESDSDGNDSATAQNNCLAQRSDERSEYLQTLATQGDESDAPEQ